MRKKVTVVGGGFVGSTTAQRIHDAGLADVVLRRRRLQRNGQQRHRRDYRRIPAQAGNEP